MSTLCRLHALQVTLGENAFGPFSVGIAPGERIAILGPSGAGKTTLLKLISGELRPQSGSYALKGIPIETWSLRALSRARAVVPQSSEVAFGLMAHLVIGLGRIAIEGDLKRDAIIQYAARLSSCEHLLHRSFDTLSGGEKARIHLARVFAQLWDEQNSLILVDEPLASLDPGLQIELLESMKRYADARNHAIVAILHDINQAMHHFDRLILVKEGCLVGDHASGMGAISVLADLYRIQLDVIERDGSPPLVFPRASLGLNTL
ncbi:ATP-binding cassette domain-containing protein [Polynucleobacter sp.]|uniref:ATP-binding cassette domain-containing protein n=1 Tax=Polynucleobacter sp. TaxID=2029855 RepID=UPI00273483F7|nr:ATP-binding cassette domain-containing protein [Polynucleobacter sp.]MDP3122051.1 ATP-binding cassette domain-containing protein [Polynucleobacter sp.]